jgi:ubiquitin carboxyl-terminal hydrolase 5/13
VRHLRAVDCEDFRQQKFASFPDIFVVHAKKFQLVNWVPTKLGTQHTLCSVRSVRSLTIVQDIPLLLPQEDIIRFEDKHLGKGIQPDEQSLPEESTAPPAAAQELEFNEAAMALITSMGFPEIRAKKALLATGNADGEVAMNWLFEHMEDPGWHSFALSKKDSLISISRH